jgi:hypothetical protein
MEQQRREQKVLAEFLNANKLEHLTQKLIEFGCDSIDALKYERDFDGLASDCGFNGEDLLKLIEAQKRLTTTNANASIGDSLKKEYLIKSAIEEAKKRQSNVGEDDGRELLRLELGKGGNRNGPKQHERIEKKLFSNVQAYDKMDMDRLMKCVEEERYFDLFNWPDAPVDSLTGKCEWRGHPAVSHAMRLDAKMVTLRLLKTKEENGDDSAMEKMCDEVIESVKDVTSVLGDQKLRARALTKEIQRKIDKLRKEGFIDLDGGFVTASGIHYGTGAAHAAAVAKENEYENYDAPGPRASSMPGARLPPREDKNKIGKLFDESERQQRQQEEQKQATTTTTNNNKTSSSHNQEHEELDLDAIRNKLSKRKKPKFM